MTSPRTADLVARDLRALWHPFTQHAVWPSDDPVVMERGEGVHLWDTDGNRYVDGVSSLWVTVHGHREPAIDDAVRAQLDRMAHSTFLGLTHEPGIELAELLLARTPGMSRVFYAGDGSSAVEVALKMAYQAAAQRGEHRPLFAHLAEAYHGDTLGAVSVGGSDLFHATYRPILLQTRRIGSPAVRAPGQSAAERAAEALDELRALLELEGPSICALIVEPLVQAASGMLTYDASFLVGARQLCSAHGVLLIVDEVATGIGRTGTFWASEQAGVVPDLLVCAKGITGGYLPLSAVLTTEAVYDAFLARPEEGKAFFHGHSYTANPLACAAAIANLRLMSERGSVAHAGALGARIGERLGEVADVVAEVRRLGTMTGIDLGGYDASLRAGFRVCQEARLRGVWIRPLGNVVVLMPPLGMTLDVLDEMLDVVCESIRVVVKELA
ncbi:MAG: adenosylmethionine---8-amino-7-oxononanoate aminotransferase [Frankiaceae bacterium]|nr:adenosylmethionine---8-amino-7-oxononanoate aminotransferase [Frankiaceae bacterium]